MNGDQNPQASQPGRQYMPGDSPPSLVEPSVPIQPVAQPTPQPVAQPAPPITQQPQPAPTSTPVASTEPAEGFYHPEDAQPPVDSAAMPDPATPQAPVAPAAASWTSSGDALQAHASSWRFKMIVASLILGGLVYLITRDAFSTGAVAVAGMLFGLLGSRKPQPLSYQLDSRGIIIGQKHYGYGEFRAFSVAHDISPSIDLVPLKRFAPMLSIRFDQTQEEQLVAILSTHLPMEAHRRDIFDQITRKIRF